jgi:uncharacterized protein related to proFAR isomerase
MEIIPVIDLKGGLVVRARHGDRAKYRRIETPLSATAEPLDVVAGLLALHPFKILYVADLDAIEETASDDLIVRRIAERFPGLDLWVDNGCSSFAAATDFLAAHSGASLVLGSESQQTGDLVRRLRDDPRIVLSLDFRGEAFLGPTELLEDAGLWPGRVVLMNLARVGGYAGPDLERLASVRRRGGDRRIYLAGGLRGPGDLASISRGGAAGILAASALHDGRLSRADLAHAAIESTG